MQVSVESTSALERRLTITVPASRIDPAVEQKLKEAAGKVKLDGFRPGKIPFAEIKRRFGKSVRQEVLSEVMSASFYEAVQQEKLNPAGVPTIEGTKGEVGQDFEFIAVIEVIPEFEVQGLENIEVVRPVVGITEDDVDATIAKLRDQRATYEDVDREARSGDQLLIDFAGTLDGEEFDGGSAEASSLVLGSNRMIPGFEDGLIGVRAGEERVLSLTFPEDYHSGSLKGKDVEFKVKVSTVAEKKLPEVDEAFIAQFGVKEKGIEAFRADVKKNMERELRKATKAKVKNQILEGLLKENAIEVPNVMVSAEIERQRKQMAQQFGNQGQFDPASLPVELFEEQAKRSVTLGLLFGELMNKHKLQADKERVKAMVSELSESYENPAEVFDWYYKNDEQMKQIESVVLEDQLVDLILGLAKVSEKQASYEDALSEGTGAQSQSGE